MYDVSCSCKGLLWKHAVRRTFRSKFYCTSSYYRHVKGVRPVYCILYFTYEGGTVRYCTARQLGSTGTTYIPLYLPPSDMILLTVPLSGCPVIIANWCFLAIPQPVVLTRIPLFVHLCSHRPPRSAPLWSSVGQAVVSCCNKSSISLY
jgi:hypothetical protein